MIACLATASGGALACQASSAGEAQVTIHAADYSSANLIFSIKGFVKAIALIQK